jgi:hypothetical protein
LHAFADVFEFAFGDVPDAADVAAAEVVDDGVEAVAGIFVGCGVDLVAGFSADAAVLVVAVCEGDASDVGCTDCVGGASGGLCCTLVRRDVGGNAEVEEGPAEGGVGVRVEADGGDGAHLGVVSCVAGVEVEGADVTVSAIKVPGRRDGEGDTVAAIMEGTSGWGGRLRGAGLALKQGWDGFGLTRNGSGLSACVDWDDAGKNCQQGDSGAGEDCGESHASLLSYSYWPRMRGLATV